MMSRSLCTCQCVRSSTSFLWKAVYVMAPDSTLAVLNEPRDRGSDKIDLNDAQIDSSEERNASTACRSKEGGLGGCLRCHQRRRSRQWCRERTPACPSRTRDATPLLARCSSTPPRRAPGCNQGARHGQVSIVHGRPESFLSSNPRMKCPLQKSESQFHRNRPRYKNIEATRSGPFLKNQGPLT